MKGTFLIDPNILFELEHPMTSKSPKEAADEEMEKKRRREKDDQEEDNHHHHHHHHEHEEKDSHHHHSHKHRESDEGSKHKHRRSEKEERHHHHRHKESDDDDDKGVDYEEKYAKVKPDGPEEKAATLLAKHWKRTREQKRLAKEYLLATWHQLDYDEG